MIDGHKSETVVVIASDFETADYCRLILSTCFNVQVFQEFTEQNPASFQRVKAVLFDYADAIRNSSILKNGLRKNFPPGGIIVRPENLYEAEEAFDSEELFFLSYPFSLQAFSAKVKYSSLEAGENFISVSQEQKRLLNRLIGSGTAIQTVKKYLVSVADTDCSMIFLGETGTGKTLAARILHELSSRKDKPFVIANVASFNQELVDSELFGTVEGAYTGAKTRPGLIETASGGTLFFDEIGNVSSSCQAKLLDFMETCTYRNVGSAKKKYADVRLVFATNADLRAQTASGTFREDFYWRIMDFPVVMPPLRHRPEDIPQIAEKLLISFAGEYKINFTMEPEALDKLVQYHWPGNVRQLVSCIRRACVLSRADGIIQPDKLILDF